MAQLLEYKCPCCGGAIEFDSSIQKMKCPYCDTEFETEALKSLDESLRQDKPDEMEWETDAGKEWQNDEEGAIKGYICRSCGGEIICDQNTAATSCPFCGNHVVMTENLKGVLKPDYVIPFKLNKEDAKQGLINHLKGKRLLPKIFKNQNHIDEVKGIYVPFWIFETDASAHIRYRATKVHTWSDKNYIYTRTSFYAVTRSGDVGFEGIPVDASIKMSDDLMESIEPYNLSQAVDFQTAYLSGYMADKYDVTAEQSIGRANERVKKSAEQVFANSVKNYATVTVESSSIRLTNGKTKYALYPVWLLNTTWNKNKYTFAMNGQTGKFAGNLPLDKGAYFRWFTLTAIIGTAAAYAVFWLINLL